MDLEILWLFVQQGVASGLVSGAVYALLALAIVIVYRTTDVANFAQGEIYMAGSYMAFFLIVVFAAPTYVAVPATVLIVCVLGAAFQRLVLTRVAAERGVSVNLVIATLGLSYLLKGLVRSTGFGDAPRSFPSLAPEGTVMIGAASLSYLDVMIFTASLAVMAVFFWVFTYTKAGRAMRAVGMNRRAAALVGISLSKVQMLVWALSGGISAIAALLIAPKLLLTVEMGHVATLAFAAAIVGGFTSLPGAVVGGFIIGIAENLVGLFFSSRAIIVTPFVVIMLVLILKPQGLFGGAIRVKKV
jgi:branched-chain amino acid transport system permease protein